MHLKKKTGTKVILKEEIRQILKILTRARIIDEISDAVTLKKPDNLEDKILSVMYDNERELQQVNQTNKRIPITANKISDKLQNKYPSLHGQISPMTVMDKLKRLEAIRMIRIVKRGPWRIKKVKGKPFHYRSYIYFIINM